ncbi:amidase domain-containing protein [Leifsonia xyli]|nr:amidase domain-containing protein [Leifsonia xyli]
MKSFVAAGLVVLLGTGVVLGAAAPSMAATTSPVDPVVTALSKAVGDVMGGEQITISGENLQNATQVCFGLGCVPVTSATSTTVEVTTPAHYGYQGGQAQAVVPDYQEDTVTVTVKLSDEEKASAPQPYRYEALTRTGREMSYVLAHWDKYDNARYADFNPVGGDCANFASAGLAEWFGRDRTRMDWYNQYGSWQASRPNINLWTDPYGYTNPDDKWVTPSWAYVPSFSNWLNDQKEQFGITRTDLSNHPATWSNVRVGDIVTMTWNDSSLKANAEGGQGLKPRTIPLTATGVGTDLGGDHSMIVSHITTVNGQLDVQLAGHNNDRNYLSLTAIYNNDPKMTGSIWHLPKNTLTNQPRIVSVARGSDGTITITGWSSPGARMKTTNDPDYGWFDPEGGITYAAADGSFTVVTKRTVNGAAVVKSFDPNTGQAISESDLPIIPQTHVDSAVRGTDGTITITGWALPGARMKTTNDPHQGWFDPEGGKTYANADGSFTVVTKRTINRQTAVKSYDPNTGQAISDSNYIPVTS